MEGPDRDDFVHALGQTLAFYGKDLDRMQTSFWITACGDKGVQRLKRALIDYTKVGKFAPKPADILAIVDNMSERGRGHKELPPPPTTNCPPEIAQAWLWFNKLITADSGMFAGVFGKGERPDTETEARYLHVVNHEAHKYSTPEAIPEEYRLPEVWG